MPLIRPQPAIRASCLLRPTTTIAAPSSSTFSPWTHSRRLLSTTPARASSSGAHEDHYDPPSGWLWGIPPGEKYKKEGWENIWYWGFFGSLGLGVVAYAYKPDTSIQTWALEEARRRLEAEGILPDPSPSTSTSGKK